MLNHIVVAVVVTYNRLELLQNCLHFVLSQKLPLGFELQIVVVDNASTDGTAQWLDDCAASETRITVLRMPKNTGGAGGFHAGMLKVLSNSSLNIKHLWLLDDDTIPTSNALHQLLYEYHEFFNTTGHQPAFICSHVLWKNEVICEMNIPTPVWDWNRYHRYTGVPDGLSLVSSCSFVSVLIPVDQARKVGLPIADFFIWSDDQEYTSRLAGLGYPGLASTSSLVHHYTRENRGVNVLLMREDEVWKYRYGMRNGAFLSRRRGLLYGCYYVANRMREIWRAPIGWFSKFKLYLALLDGWLLFNPAHYDEPI
jgi:GT2 family glycosyltransferase